MAIGAITNVALALKKEPTIIDKIEVIWLGGNELGYNDINEQNAAEVFEKIAEIQSRKV